MQVLDYCMNNQLVVNEGLEVNRVSSGTVSIVNLLSCSRIEWFNCVCKCLPGGRRVDLF